MFRNAIGAVLGAAALATVLAAFYGQCGTVLSPSRAADESLLSLGIPAEAPLLLILPGSRSGEVRRLAGPFGAELCGYAPLNESTQTVAEASTVEPMAGALALVMVLSPQLELETP